MTRIWLKVNEFKKDVITSALEAGIDTFLCEEKEAEQIRALAKVIIAGTGGDLQPDKDYFSIDIQTKADEEKAASLGQTKPVVITTPNWEIIPIENLIASGAQVIWQVPDFAKAKLAFEIMEKGVSGVVLATEDAAEVRRFSALINEQGQPVPLAECEVISVESVGLADRICVDTATHMSAEQGMLAGNSSGGMLLVQSEASENPYVAARPFRVNLSAVHAYTPRPGGKTSYLSELKSGDKVLVVNKDGQSELALVGRIKMERRPMIQLTFRPHKNSSDAKAYSLLLQNAETVRLFKADGTPISVAKIKPGDILLGKFDKLGRHFGMAIEESIEEK